MIIKCTECNKEFKRFKSQIQDTNNFCSRSCSVLFNNKKNPKRKLTNKCKECNTPIKASSVRCKNCTDYKVYYTLGEVIEGRKDSRRSTIYSGIRDRARRKYLPNKNGKCENCGYDIHVEVCHKKPISDFDGSARINEEINHPDNIIILCRNCHWEFDNGLLTDLT